MTKAAIGAIVAGTLLALSAAAQARAEQLPSYAGRYSFPTETGKRHIVVVTQDGRHVTARVTPAGFRWTDVFGDFSCVNAARDEPRLDVLFTAFIGAGGRLTKVDVPAGAVEITDPGPPVTDPNGNPHRRCAYWPIVGASGRLQRSEDIDQDAPGFAFRPPPHERYLVLHTTYETGCAAGGAPKVSRCLKFIYLKREDGDRDGDGLPDAWEKHGVHIGRHFLDLPAMGADPDHKDLFVEVDHAAGADPYPRILRQAYRVFLDAPLTNPDGRRGIRLHLDDGPHSTMNPVTRATWGARSASERGLTVPPAMAMLGACGSPAATYPWGAGFDPVRDRHLEAVRHHVFRYALIVQHVDAAHCAGGLARDSPASDLVVGTTNAADVPVTAAWFASTFFRTLGQALGMHHGGLDDVDFKPADRSTMNDRFADGIRDAPGADATIAYAHDDWSALRFAGGAIGAAGRLDMRRRTRTTQPVALDDLVAFQRSLAGDVTAPTLSLARRGGFVEVSARDDKGLAGVRVQLGRRTVLLNQTVRRLPRDRRQLTIAPPLRSIEERLRIRTNVRTITAVAFDAYGLRSPQATLRVR
jgi:hypothetical protein